MEPGKRLSGWQFLRREASRKGWAGYALFGTLLAFVTVPDVAILAMERTGWASAVLGAAGAVLMPSLAVAVLGVKSVQDYVTGDGKGAGGGDGEG